MHAGNPFIDEMIGLLWAFPSVYVDLTYIEQAEFLTPAQKDRILCRNAARFFRLGRLAACL